MEGSCRHLRVFHQVDPLDAEEEAVLVYQATLNESSHPLIFLQADPADGALSRVPDLYNLHVAV